MEIRHQHLAHAGQSDEEIIFATANFDIQGKDITWALGYEIIQRITHSESESADFLDVIDHLIQLSGAKRDENAAAFMKAVSPEERNALLEKAIKQKQGHK